MMLISKKFLIPLAGLIFAASLFVQAQSQRNLLCKDVSPEKLRSILIPQTQWYPLPTINDREEWKIIPEKLQAAHIKRGEAFLGKPWEVLPASVFLDYNRNGNRVRYEAVFFERRQRLMSLVMAEIFESKGRFLDEIANGVWAICEETYWGLPAHVGEQKRGSGLPDVNEPTIDLFAAETGAMLAYVSYLLEDKLTDVSPLLKERICFEEDRRIITPYNKVNYWWKGFTPNRSINNWNPWINSNVLAVVSLLEKDEERRCGTIYKLMQSTDAFINSYPDDGGCDEGPGYWSRAGGSLFDFLNILNSATSNKITLYDNILIRRMGRFIYNAWIKDDYYINFADASARNKPEAGLVYRFGKCLNDSVMVGFGAFLSKQQNISDVPFIPEHGSPIRFLPNILEIKNILETKAVEPYIKNVWLPNLQVMASRSSDNSSHGFYLAAKGGHNDESHNHNDVGNFIVYANGKPLLIDIGVETYTAKTFSSDRYDIWTMQSQYHNLPTINGVQQKDGKEFCASNVKFVSDDNHSQFSLDLTKCYPAEASINYWKRNLKLVQDPKIILNEEYSLKNWIAPTTINFITTMKIDITKPGVVTLFNQNTSPAQFYQISYDNNKFSAAVDDHEINDSRLSPVWGNRISRIVFTSRDKILQDSYTIEITERKK